MTEVSRARRLPQPDPATDFQAVAAAPVDGPVEAPPWRPELGPAPTVMVWPPGRTPALMVRAAGRWRYAPVHARHAYPDGRVAYMVTVDLTGRLEVVYRTYWWPQPGLRVAHGSAVEPVPPDGRHYLQAAMPAAPPRSIRPRPGPRGGDGAGGAA